MEAYIKCLEEVVRPRNWRVDAGRPLTWDNRILRHVIKQENPVKIVREFQKPDNLPIPGHLTSHIETSLIIMWSTFVRETKISTTAKVS